MSCVVSGVTPDGQTVDHWSPLDNAQVHVERFQRSGYTGITVESGGGNIADSDCNADPNG